MDANRSRDSGLLLCLFCLMLAAGCGVKPGTTAGTSATKALKPPPIHTPQANVKPRGVLPSFQMVGRESGFAFERYDDMQGLRRILEANGGGVALFDFDRDGWLDVFMTNGCRLPLKLHDRDSPGELFRNRGDMHFERVTSESSLLQFGYTHGCAVGDYDADGFDDLYITAFGPNALWRNNGDGTFTDVAQYTGTTVPQWSSSAAFADLNGDGHLDLYVVNYLAESDESPTLCRNPKSPDGYQQCPPAMFEGVDDVLFLADGEGRFVDATAASGLAGMRGKGLGVVISDLDGDGHPEIFVANDGEANFLFVPVLEAPGDSGGRSRHGPPKFRYREQALSSGVGLCESGYAQANMGIAAGDYDADGTTDLFITTFFGDTNTLYENRGGLTFADVTRTTNLGATSRNKLGFGTAFVDVDNDGWLDLLVANGHVDDRTWMSHGEPYRMRPQLYRNERNGSFADVSESSGAYFLKEWLGRGVAVGDLDRDGKMDAVISHQLASSVMIKNETQTENAAVVLRLVGTTSNRNGYCARVEVIGAETPLVRELVGGASFQSASALEIHVGIGPNRRATVRIHWPSGIVDTHAELAAGGWVVIEGQGAKSFQIWESVH